MDHVTPGFSIFSSGGPTDPSFDSSSSKMTIFEKSGHWPGSPALPCEIWSLAGQPCFTPALNQCGG
eukprot:756641-Hanusia_phi.AAC.2